MNELYIENLNEFGNSGMGSSKLIIPLLDTSILVLLITFIIIAILLFLYGIVKYLSVKKRYYNIRKRNEKEKNVKYTLEYVMKYKKRMIYLIIISILCLMIAGYLNLTRIYSISSDKPIIYIYPDKETVVEVKLFNPEKLSCSYPKYEDSWKVLAKPNGDLLDLKTNRELYALYWEGLNTVSSRKMDEGFCVKGEDSAKFLEEKLEILGLNDRESEEFIVYWLPILEKSKYNYIRFETMDEINDNMALEINPKPDTLIRVIMEFKGLNKPIKLTNQKLERVERNGYTVVEWGGTKLK